MTPQSYELSFEGTLIVLFFCLVLFLLVLKLLVAVIRRILVCFLGVFKPGSGKYVESSTQTQVGDVDMKGEPRNPYCDWSDSNTAASASVSGDRRKQD
ncbi:hypothetical protein BaRGS_00037625 [Batillaria attramentaria]|uniref:ATP synthase F0 subunit 8 n=1 Tax=Batillaria attramentaria TaxID=370345 RepID=A0ABD0J8C1_9CAEN